MELKAKRAPARLLACRQSWQMLWGVQLILLLILVGLAILSLSVGSAGISGREIVEALLDPTPSTTRQIILQLRLPRLIVACLVGACLATAGALLQAVMQNPLADPGIIGVSSGAATTATVVMLLFPQMIQSVPLFAFGGAMLSCVLIYALAYEGGISPLRIVLAGVAVNTVLGGINALLQLLYSDSLSGVIAFLNGSLAARSWRHVQVLLTYGLPGLVLAFLGIRGANALQLGDEMASNLGFKTSRTRLFLSALGAFLAAVTVSAVGMVGFIGLVVPHVVRLLVGSDYRRLLPASILLGAVVALGADTLGRVLIPGMELPLGMIMSVLGGPFFLYLLKTRGKRGF